MSTSSVTGATGSAATLSGGVGSNSSNNNTTGSNTNLMTASSTPIRIGSGKQQQQQQYYAHNLTTGGASGDSPTVVASSTTSSGSTLQLPHQSSSVPTTSHLHLQSPAALSIGASNQSLGVSIGAGSNVSGISITPPNSAGLRQAGELLLMCAVAGMATSEPRLVPYCAERSVGRLVGLCWSAWAQHIVATHIRAMPVPFALTQCISISRRESTVGI